MSPSPFDGDPFEALAGIELRDPPPPPRSIFELTDRIACLKCGAQPGEVCRTPAGRRRAHGKPHDVRSISGSIVSIAILTTLARRRGTIEVIGAMFRESIEQATAPR